MVLIDGEILSKSSFSFSPPFFIFTLIFLSWKKKKSMSLLSFLASRRGKKENEDFSFSLITKYRKKKKKKCGSQIKEFLSFSLSFLKVSRRILSSCPSSPCYLLQQIGCFDPSFCNNFNIHDDQFIFYL